MKTRSTSNNLNHLNNYSNKYSYDEHSNFSNSTYQYQMDPNRYYNLNNPLYANPGTITRPNNIVNVETFLSNRTIKHSKNRDHNINIVNTNKVPAPKQYNYNDTLPSISTHLQVQHPPTREQFVNRFDPLLSNPQRNIYWNRSTMTQLEAKDNYQVKLPKINN